MEAGGQFGVPVAASSGNVAAAQAQATLAASPGNITYISGFDFTFAGATGASAVLLTVVGLAGGTQSFVVTVPAGAAIGGVPLLVRYPEPLPASAPNTAIVVTCPSLGAGNTNACLNVQGFQA